MIVSHIFFGRSISKVTGQMDFPFQSPLPLFNSNRMLPLSNCKLCEGIFEVLCLLQWEVVDNILSTLMMSAEKCTMGFSHDGRCPKQDVLNINIPITNNNFDCEFIVLQLSGKITIENPLFQPGSC
jgi:hypothetical protein